MKSPRQNNAFFSTRQSRSAAALFLYRLPLYHKTPNHREKCRKGSGKQTPLGRPDNRWNPHLFTCSWRSMTAALPRNRFTVPRAVAAIRKSGTSHKCKRALCSFLCRGQGMAKNAPLVERKTRARYPPVIITLFWRFPAQFFRFILR